MVISISGGGEVSRELFGTSDVLTKSHVEELHSSRLGVLVPILVEAFPGL